jgi:hypothetical protein
VRQKPADLGSSVSAIAKEVARVRPDRTPAGCSNKSAGQCAGWRRSKDPHRRLSVFRIGDDGKLTFVRKYDT